MNGLCDVFPGNVFDAGKIDCDTTQYVVGGYFNMRIICIFIYENICCGKLMTMLQLVVAYI